MKDKTEKKLDEAVLAYRYRITQFGDWKTELVKDDIRKLINSEVTAVLDELEKQAGWYSQQFNDKARKDGVEDTLVPLSAIQALKQRYGGK